MKSFKELIEKTLTPAELKKREEIAKAMERENPGMEMGKKMAIATAAAKRVAEEVEEAADTMTQRRILAQKQRLAVGAKAKDAEQRRELERKQRLARSKRMAEETEDLEEQTAEAPSLQKHRIGVRVTNPNNKREVKYVVVTHSSDKKGAQAVGEKHMKKKGYFVHGSFHSGMVSEEVELDEATDFHDKAMEHKKQADSSMDKNDLEAYHMHMSSHHECMGEWHESKGRSSAADKEYDKAEKHHDLSISKSKQKNEGTSMLSFKHFQVALEEAKKSYKESELENAHDMKDKDDEEEEMKEARTQTKDASGKVTGYRDEGDWKKSQGKEGRGKATNLSDKARKEMEKMAKLKEEVELEEMKGDMHPDADKVLKHIKPEHHSTYKPYLKKGVYKGDYKDRSAVLSSAEKAGHIKEEVELDEVSPFDWKAYAKEKAKSATTSGTTKTYHDVKKTATGTVYTKQTTPDGMSKGSGEDAAKAEEPEVKRSRGRPAGVGAKAGGYKPRDPAKKAASAAKAAASKAAGRAMRKESFDLEFMESLIEGFEDEDFDDFIQSEEFENLDETTQESLISFINEKSCGSYKMKESLTGKQHKLDKNKNGKLDSHDFKLLRKEAEEIEELSKKTLGSYVKAAAKDAEDAGRDQEYHGHQNDYKRGEKRQKGIEKAVDRLMKEETEQIKESVNAYAAFLTKKQ